MLIGGYTGPLSRQTCSFFLTSHHHPSEHHRYKESPFSPYLFHSLIPFIIHRDKFLRSMDKHRPLTATPLKFRWPLHRVFLGVFQGGDILISHQECNFVVLEFFSSCCHRIFTATAFVTITAAAATASGPCSCGGARATFFHTHTNSSRTNITYIIATWLR